MNFYKAVLWALPLSLLSNLGTVALARKADLQVFPSNGPVANCPQALVAYETPQPYSPGGYATDGMIQLSEIATDISISQVDDFSVTWIGTLKPEYFDCQATAGIISFDGEAYQGHSYIRAQFADGQVKVILDMTGVRDANDFTTEIIYQGMRDGNPRWTWGGTD
ncbi:MAG: hypothetical protein F6K42_17430 [Leptolyngbya sp. SIO1D8]|nr:hypothetical protein [Leptolyngbya sp. SIO1D8]